jgi:protocatechuate 3,4-dioxygenase, beta subunit
MKRPVITLLAVLLLGCACGPGSANQESGGATEAPPGLGAEARIAGPDEPGERLVITGTVYRKDGRTPAPGVVVYAYHTNAEGIYPTRGDEKGNAHGYLRGWVKTDGQGRYRFSTIRPGSYPSRISAAHIHMTVREPEREEVSIKETLFEGDPLLNEREREHGVVIKLTRGQNGVWTGVRDIVLEQ